MRDFLKKGRKPLWRNGARFDFCKLKSAGCTRSNGLHLHSFLGPYNPPYNSGPIALRPFVTDMSDKCSFSLQKTKLYTQYILWQYTHSHLPLLCEKRWWCCRMICKWILLIWLWKYDFYRYNLVSGRAHHMYILYIQAMLAAVVSTFIT